MTPTDAEVDGYWFSIGAVTHPEVQASVFVDRTLGHLALWFGVSTEVKSKINQVDELASGRWPAVQRIRKSGRQRYKNLSYSDPVSERYYDEYFFGWYAEEVPVDSRDTARAARRVVDGIRLLLIQISAPPDAPELVDQLDRMGKAKFRGEQALLRKYLLTGHRRECEICGRIFPKDLLVAAHIKRRAECSDKEKRDFDNNVMALCAIGCDALFERGYISVKNGHVISGPRASADRDVKDYISELVGRRVSKWNRASKVYFASHRNRLLTGATDN